ncbi:similar to peroxisomal AMP binding enzyme [Plenodomus lingam JN3]|uniref:Similar to peroxisomal AMP binding enzyme n=1 Tax=Leptosphaeria maculans (strain JN3 / isolate v23.1.3 / race Av1-4-5-6-7-8) TaxID=985895 RepID=E4ZTW2_LEPMJ|nr:similar to peroxisomal AMP binding enzyme [Plenodomus lingam JN3]CBX94672.1 similar to peroxisomal AMP binding enzyme [Plenodomus lingam JN3]
MWARRLLPRTLATRQHCLFFSVPPLQPSFAYYTYNTDNTNCCHTSPPLPPASRMASTLPRLPIFEAIQNHDAHSTAVVHSLSGRTFTYGQLVNDVAAAKDMLQRNTGGKSAEGERISFLVENGYDYVVTLLSILAAHAVAVPLSPTFPAHELRYIIDQSESLMLLSSEKFQTQADDVLKEGMQMKPINYKQEKIMMGKTDDYVTLEEPTSDKGGMMLYTSGTTNRPKGVLLPQDVLTAQSRSLLQAWNYTKDDVLLHVLPLHHIHGTVNALLTPLFAGSTIEFQFPFNASAVWNRLGAPFLPHSPNSPSTQPPRPITFLTVVPTIYTRLLSAHASLSPDLQSATKTALHPTNLRLNISGSAALPTPVKSAWTELSGGNVLLERYGMTEVGMALSCGLSFADRIDGSVGWPLPNVEARLVDSETQQVIPEDEEVDKDGRPRQGEIQLRGPTIFREYWKNPEATAKEFVDDQDGRGRWFKTGDVAMRRHVAGAGQNAQQQPWCQGPLYFILGRQSADIIKTGGEKVSALEIEREMLSLPEIAEVAVVGLPSEAWGQKVAAVVVLSERGRRAGKGGKAWGVLDLRRALKERLAAYKIPQEMRVVEGIPRNAMGKINKKQLVVQIWGENLSASANGAVVVPSGSV